MTRSPASKRAGRLAAQCGKTAAAVGHTACSAAISQPSLDHGVLGGIQGVTVHTSPDSLHEPCLTQDDSPETSWTHSQGGNVYRQVTVTSNTSDGPPPAGDVDMPQHDS